MDGRHGGDALSYKFLMNMALLGLIMCSAVALAQDANGWKVGQAVKTTGGLIVGHAANTMKGHDQVSEYLGIRYAEPVVGARRWLAPQPYKRNGTLKADKFVRLNSVSIILLIISGAVSYIPGASSVLLTE
jgi:hypothetical protein